MYITELKSCNIRYFIKVGQCKSGIPQGSILGPLMFLIYIRDLPEVVKFSQVALFADNAKLFKVVGSEEDCIKLHRDIDSLYEWSVKWGLSLNTSKCKISSVTRFAHPFVFNYQLNCEHLEYVDRISDLGVIVDNTVSWNSHVNHIIKKVVERSTRIHTKFT